jgi:hypothetical protein
VALAGEMKGEIGKNYTNINKTMRKKFTETPSKP